MVRLLLAALLAPGAFGQVDINKYFHGTEGSFVLLDLSNHRYIRNDEAHCRKRLTPMSTFKIPNSLISLETGVVPDAEQMTKWDGVLRERPEWNRDQNLASAFSVSAVWYYQRLAAQVGNERMRDYLRKIRYGNEDISGGITQFWLHRSLAISADEQVDFLRRLLDGELPFSARTVDIVKRIMIVDQHDGAILRGKMGNGFTKGKHDISWFVGYVERGGRKYIFAANLEGPELPAALTLAKDVSLAVLREMGLY
jgi:beta-lactamase class D